MRKNVFRRFLAVALCAALVLSLAAGCAEKAPEAPAASVSYPDCREPLDYLAQRNGMAGAVGRGALQGGLIGLLSAAVYGAISGRGSAVGIGASAGAGMAAGGTLGALGRGASREDTRRLSRYLEQIDGDISGLDDVKSAGATLAMQCYDKKFAELLAQTRKRELAREAAKERFAEIIRGREEAASLLGRPAESGEYEKQFNGALGE